MFQQFANATRASLQIGHRALMLVVACCAASMLAPHAGAQTCEPTWLPGEPGANLSGSVAAFINFDPDGAGPSPSLLIAGGFQIVIPGYEPQKLVAFDGQYWRPIETGAGSGSVNALTVFNNQLIVAGDFASIDATAITDVASWNGTTWTQMSGGLGTGGVNALAVYNNQLYMGGTYSNGVAVNGIARWTGTLWAAVTTGVTGGFREVHALLPFRGVLYVGGIFTTAGGVPAANLASWDGTTWAAAGNPDGAVYALGSFSGLAVGSSRLFVGGDFLNIGGIAAESVASLRFDPINGNTWIALSATSMLSSSSCHGLLVRNSGVSSFQVHALLRTTPVIIGSSTQDVYRLSGSSWTSLGLAGSATSLGVYSGQLLAGSSTGISRVFAFDNTAWTPLGKGTPGRISALAARTGDLFAAATVPSEIVPIPSVFERDSATGAWTSIGKADAVIESLLVTSNGTLVAGGQFSRLDVSAAKIAQWNGATWAPLGLGIGTGSSFSVKALAETASGDIIAGGFFNTAGGQSSLAIARWNGLAWSPIGNGIVGTVNALAIAGNGDIIAGGSFTSASGTAASNIARWNGANWLALAGGLPNGIVQAVAILQDGSIIAGGTFDTGGASPLRGIAKWNGSAWVSIGAITNGSSPGRVQSLRTLANGHLIAAGTFDSAGGVSVKNIARWDGTAWHALDEGTTGGLGVSTPSSILALALENGDTLAVGGSFLRAGNEVSAYFARWGLPTQGCCDSIDFNNNTVFPEDQDVIDFFNVLAGGECSPGNTCNDIDFNNNTVFPEDQDVIDFFTVLAGGECS